MRKFIILTFLSVFLLSPQFVFADCWSSKENSKISGFSELDNEIILSFKDAVDCKPVSDAKFFLSGKTFNTDQKGYVILPLKMFAQIDDKEMAFKIEKDGYITLETGLIINVGTVLNKRFLLSKNLPLGKIRFVLQWGEKPSDLDLHFLGRDFHISYRNKKNVHKRAKLDIDETDGYGPETITVEKTRKESQYRLFVHNYSGDAEINSEAVVYIYAYNKLNKIIRLPETSKSTVKILDIKENSFFYVNKPVAKVKY